LTLKEEAMARSFHMEETVTVTHPTTGKRLNVPPAMAKDFKPWKGKTEAKTAPDPEAQAAAAAAAAAAAKEPLVEEPAPAVAKPVVPAVKPADPGEWTPQEIDGVGPERWKTLQEAGFTSRETVVAAGVEGVAAVLGSETLARKIVAAAKA
jgi:predicted flap endonuclease-1-like 5' DNA nuclease